MSGCQMSGAGAKRHMKYSLVVSERVEPPMLVGRLM